VEERTVTGVPGRALVDTARSVNAQLIVLATRGEQAARLLGAASQYVLRHAPCPVLVVPRASKGL
jgi:nucleotide-binding universal stress UspA family protein